MKLLKVVAPLSMNTNFLLCKRSSYSTMGGQKVTFPSSHPAGQGHGVVFGDAKTTKKGLIVIHEWWGFTEWIQQKGEELARDGDLVVMVPDFYRGKVAIDREEAGHLMHGLDWQGACQDISGAAKLLLSLGCLKIGVTGFCMGGALTFAAAVKCPEISAAVPFYGIPNQSKFDLTKIRIPVQAHFGLKDVVVGLSSPEDFNPLKDKLLSTGVPYECHVYDAGHGFTNPTSPFYDESSGKIAIGRMIKFLHSKLNGQVAL